MIVYISVIQHTCPVCGCKTAQLGRSTIDGKAYAKCIRSTCQNEVEIDRFRENITPGAPGRRRS